MKALEKIEYTEDYLAGMLIQWPEIVTTIPFEIEIFTKWRSVVEEIIRQLNAGLKPDLITVTEALPGDDLLLYNLGTLAKNTPSKSNYAIYLSQLADLRNEVSVYRQLHAGLKAIHDGEKASVVFGQVVNNALSALSNKHPKFNFTMPEIMSMMSDRLEEMHGNRDSLKDKVKTGIYRVDQVIGHIQPSNLVIIGARPAVGKTSIVATMMLNMAKDGKRVGFISSEMSAVEISYRLTAQISKIQGARIRDGNLTGDDWREISLASTNIAKLPIRICDKPSIKISEVVMQCRAWDMDGGLDVVIVDYLTRIKPDKPLHNQNLDIGEIATQFKNLARMMKLPVIVLAQLNRDSAKRAEKKPNMADLRDSGIIEQEADYILLLHREIDQQSMGDKNFIIIEKNRHGEAGIDLLVDFDKNTMRWS